MPVAVKMLHPAIFATPAQPISTGAPQASVEEVALLTELEVLMRIRHPNVIQLLGEDRIASYCFLLL